jgi:UDP-glucuronate 4-epimerase
MCAAVASAAAAETSLAPTATTIVKPHTKAKKVLVTGGAGFVGSHVADALLARGDAVVIMDEVNEYYNVSIKEGNLAYLQDKHGTEKLTIYRGDIADEAFVDKVFRKEKPAWVCHMAARAGVRPSIQNPFIYLHSNILGTVRLMDAAVRYKVKNFVYASSSSVYGGSAESLFDEDQNVDFPISPYAASKNMCELFAYTWRHLYNLPVTGLRFFTVYGPRGRPDMAPFIFIDRVSRGVPISKFGNGTSSRDYTYIDDIVDGVVRAIDRPYMYQVVNLGKGNGTLLSDFIGLVEKFVKKPALIEQKPDQPGDVPYTCANVTKAKELLGYESETPFEKGIKKTVAWYRKAYPIMAEEDVASNVTADESTEVNERRDTRQRRRLSAPRPIARRLQDTSERFLRQPAEKNDDVDLSQLSWHNEPILEAHTGRKKVLVTGAAGFIGSHVADFLLDRGDEVVVVDEVNDYYDVTIKENNLQLLRDKYADTGRLTIYRGDIVDEKLMRKIFRKDKPKWICHMAARAGVRPSIDDPYVYIHSNIVGTTRLLALAAEFGVDNFVFASSSSVYGGSESTYFSELEQVIYPISPYAASKKSCELIAYTFHHLYQIPITGLRFFTVYGPRGRPDMAPFKFVDLVSRGMELPQYGDGTSSRDYTYVDDIVDGVVRAVDRPYPYQVFNLGKGSGTKLSEFIDLVQNYTGKEAHIKILPDQAGDVPYTCADVRKAEYLLGYRAKVPFDEGIKRTVEWYQQTYPQLATDTDDTVVEMPAPTELKPTGKHPHPTPGSATSSGGTPAEPVAPSNTAPSKPIAPSKNSPSVPMTPSVITPSKPIAPSQAAPSKPANVPPSDTADKENGSPSKADAGQKTEKEETTEYNMVRADQRFVIQLVYYWIFFSSLFF